jgi:hypothetical protein
MFYDDDTEAFDDWDSLVEQRTTQPLDDGDSLIGDPTRPTTTDIGSIIAAAMRAAGAPGGQRQRVFQEAVFPVGVRPSTRRARSRLGSERSDRMSRS